MTISFLFPQDSVIFPGVIMPDDHETQEIIKTIEIIVLIIIIIVVGIYLVYTYHNLYTLKIERIHEYDIDFIDYLLYDVKGVKMKLKDYLNGIHPKNKLIEEEILNRTYQTNPDGTKKGRNIIYFLELNNGTNKNIYVGECENLEERMKSHHKFDKKYPKYDIIYFFTSSWIVGHIREVIESIFIKTLKQIGEYTIDNKVENKNRNLSFEDKEIIFKFIDLISKIMSSFYNIKLSLSNN